MAAMKVEKLEQCVTSGKDWKEVGQMANSYFCTFFNIFSVL
jgi:hypothetical protein